MKTRNVALGFVFLIIIIAAVLIIKDIYKPKLVVSPSVTPTIEHVPGKFNGLTVPQGAATANLSDISGGQGTGVVILEKTNGTFSYTVAANLPAPTTGVYQAYLTDGKTTLLMGTLTVGKGGYIVNYSSVKDLSGYKTVFVALGTTHILEGSFQ